MKNSVEEKWQNYPDEQYRYFLYERDNGMMFFKSVEERQDQFEDFKDSYLDDTWDEEIENILVGEVTHTTRQTNKVERPELNEDGEDEEGNVWPQSWDYKCDYALIPLTATPH